MTYSIKNNSYIQASNPYKFQKCDATAVHFADMFTILKKVILTVVFFPVPPLKKYLIAGSVRFVE